MNAFSTVVAGAQAIVAAYGVSITPPLAIAASLYSLFLSQGAQAIQAWLNAQTEDQITKALYCGITSQSLVTANHFASLIGAEMDSDANKATWFANCARMLGDDLTNRIWRLGAADPSNACQVYDCGDTTNIVFTFGTQTGNFPSNQFTSPTHFTYPASLTLTGAIAYSDSVLSGMVLKSGRTGAALAARRDTGNLLAYVEVSFSQEVTIVAIEAYAYSFLPLLNQADDARLRYNGVQVFFGLAAPWTRIYQEFNPPITARTHRIEISNYAPDITADLRLDSVTLFVQ
jgi:hypothetical protein